MTPGEHLARRAGRHRRGSPPARWATSSSPRPRCRCSSTSCRRWRRWPPSADRARSAAPPSCGSRRATASPRWSTGLRAMGADADEFDDGFAVRGSRRLTGGTVDAHHDHRLAMAFAVAALGATGPTAHPRRRGGRGVVPALLRDARRPAGVTADKVYLVGLHGRRQVHGGPRPGPPARLAGRGRRRPHRAARAARHPTIFRQSGEAYFRALERRVLVDLLPERGVVVATGGGTPVDPANRALMLRDGAVAWLDLPFDRVVERIAARRPPAAGRRSRRDGAAL